MFEHSDTSPQVRMLTFDGKRRIYLLFLRTDQLVILTPDEVHRLAHDLMDWSLWLEDQDVPV